MCRPTFVMLHPTGQHASPSYPPLPTAFEVATPENVYYMFADSETEKDVWIGAIGRAIVTFSASYTRDDGADDDDE